MVADRQENRYSRIGKSRNAPHKLPLLSLGRISALVSIPSEEYQIDKVVNRVLDNLVKRCQEVEQSRRDSKVCRPIDTRGKVVRQRLHIEFGSRPAIVLNPNMNI